MAKEARETKKVTKVTKDAKKKNSKAKKVSKGPKESYVKKVKKELVLNEKCEDIPAVKIFQVLDKFALANACETNEYDKDLTCFGLTVYVPKKEGKIYYDDQIIKPSKKQCISFEETYQYEAGRGEFKRMKTVPVLKIINKYKQ